VLDQGVPPLDSRVSEVANLKIRLPTHIIYLLTVELLPLLVVKFLVEMLDSISVCEVYEGIAHIALVLHS